MNGFLRRSLGIALTGLLTIALAVGAAVAVASSGSGKEGTTDSTGTTDNSGPGNSEDRTNTHTQEDRTTADDKRGNRGKSEDHRRDGTGTLPNPGKAKQGERLNLGKGKGKVKVRLPGSKRAIPLTKDASVPVGSVLDARKGEVTVNTVPREDGAKQWATFSGATFQVLQPKTGVPITTIRLRGGNFASCGRPFGNRSMVARLLGPVVTTSRRKRKARSLWARGKGHFRTRGRNGAATVRGTVWLTQDRCDGTLVKVRRGIVDVRDFAKKKTVAVRAGHSYLARRKR